MQPSIAARSLVSEGRLREAGTLLDEELSKSPNNDDLWYMRGIISLKLSNYENAHECFEHALSLKKTARYYKVIGMAHLEMFEIEDAVEAFSHAIELDKKDPETYFFIALCLIFLDDPRSKEYMEKAYLRDKKKTKALLKGFYESFFARDPQLKTKIKKEIEARINSIS